MNVWSLIVVRWIISVYRGCRWLRGWLLGMAGLHWWLSLERGKRGRGRGRRKRKRTRLSVGWWMRGEGRERWGGRECLIRNRIWDRWWLICNRIGIWEWLIWMSIWRIVGLIILIALWVIDILCIYRYGWRSWGLVGVGIRLVLECFLGFLGSFWGEMMALWGVLALV